MCNSGVTNFCTTNTRMLIMIKCNKKGSLQEKEVCMFKKFEWLLNKCFSQVI